MKTINAIPVTVLSGFLGSGKTTLLNRLLAHNPHAAVIINEFGDTPVDQRLLHEHNIPLSTLAGGCLCCQVIGSLPPLLKNLRMAWESKTDKPFARVFIETSGVANPEPVLDTLLRDRWLAARYRLEAMVTAVSVADGAGVLARHPEARSQLAWADCLVLTHGDMATSAQRASLNEFLNRYAPGIPRLSARHGETEAPIPLATGHRRKDRASIAVPIPDHPFSSILFQLDQPVAWHHLETVLTLLLTRFQGQLLRIKGVVYTTDDDRPLLVQAAQGRLYPPAHLPLSPGQNGRGRLVFITAGELPDLPSWLMDQWRTSHHH